MSVDTEHRERARRAERARSRTPTPATSSPGHARRFGNGLVVTASFEDPVLVHVVADVARDGRGRAARHAVPVRRDALVRASASPASSDSTS